MCESGNCPAGTTEKVNCWPEPEVPQNMDMTVGDLGLTNTEENQIVAFLKTLNDGYTRPYPDINTYTGACMTGGNASTQGNSSIIPADLLRRMMESGDTQVKKGSMGVISMLPKSPFPGQDQLSDALRGSHMRGLHTHRRLLSPGIMAVAGVVLFSKRNPRSGKLPTQDTSTCSCSPACADQRRTGDRINKR